MRISSIQSGAAGMLLALGSVAAFAQAPAAVGVTNQTAAEANQKAVPRSDTGTLVRTSPNAADTTRNAASQVAPSTVEPAAAPVVRRPRADRN